MATLEELTAQVAALQEQMDALTTPPSDYYVSQHSGEEIDAAISGGVRFDAAQSLTANQQHTAQKNIGTTWPCNPNLLDNWCFLPGCVVNQRGQTSYTVNGNICHDRWLNEMPGGSITLGASGMALSNSNATGAAIFIQKCDVSTANTLLGKTLTLSALTSENDLLTATETLPTEMPTNVALYGPAAQRSWGDVSLVFFTGTQSYQTCRIVLHVGKSVTIIAVKLELGDQQTLAHQDADGNWVLNEIPNYAEQLARCQRYQRFVSRGTLCQIVNNESIVLKVPFDGPMRAAPAISVINPQMAFCTATVWFPIPSGPVSVVSANVTEYGITYIHLAGWDFSSGSVLLPAETLGTLATDNVILLDANL